MRGVFIIEKIKVLIVDDSALVRQFLSETLSADPSIEVIGTALDPIFAFSKIMKDKPDVITLDVEMPRMDGLTFLHKLMNSYPIPVVMISSLTKRGCETTMKALELGAVDFIPKPERNLAAELPALKGEILRKVKNAAKANIKVSKDLVLGNDFSPTCVSQQDLGNPSLFKCQNSSSRPKVVVLGASTGGVAAVKKVLSGINARSVAVLVVLHMPKGFTTSFAGNLNSFLPFPVKEAVTGDVLKPGCVYVAPGSRNMFLENNGGMKLIVKNCDREDIYRPSVDKTFISVAKAVGQNAIAIILTGMGDDGARGMALLHQVGAYTIAQSKETSMIFGMPKRAIEMGGVKEVLHVDRIAERVNKLIEN